jgi:two-component system chemotaxis response regulator CheB
MIKLLIVDDSALMRKHLTGVFSEEGGFELHTARNGEEALIAAAEFRPHVVTLDINMPVMDGLSCLSRLMVEYPCPVVMLSSLTDKGALATLEALAMGAVDYIAKPGGTISLSIEQIERELVNKVRSAARARLRKTQGLVNRVRREHNKLAARPRPQKHGVVEGVVLIGVSTGGPATLEEVLPVLPADFPWPVVIAQHMPANFTGALAQRMNTRCDLDVVEASTPLPLEVGKVYIGKGDADVVLARRGRKLVVTPRPANSQALWHPCVDDLVDSALQFFAPEQIVGVQLTGMGYDGARAFAELHRRGGRTIAESQDSAVVFGMPEQLIERGGASMVLPAGQVVRQLKRWVN